MDKLVIDGELKLWLQDGSYLSDAIEIDGQDLVDLIRVSFNQKDIYKDVNLGKVRITIEPLC